MNALDYLSQAYLLEQQVQSKLAQIESLKSLASYMTARPTDQEPVSHTKNVHAMEDTVLKIMEANQELDAQIDALVDKKLEIASVISQIRSVTYRLIMEKRYLTFCMFEEIAVDLHFSIRTVQRMHAKALEIVQGILDQNMNDGGLDYAN